jgi:hypothetical protein
VTEAEVTRMLARKRLARSLLETRKWTSMFVPLCQDHRHTSRAFMCSYIENTRDNLGIYQDYASQVKLSDKDAFNDTHKPQPPRHTAKTRTLHPPTAPAHRHVETTPSPPRASWVSSACQTWLPNGCPLQWSHSRANAQRIRSRPGAPVSQTQASCE